MAIDSITQTISTIPMAGKRGVDVQTIFVNKQEAFQDALTEVFVGQINTLRTQLNTFAGQVNTTATQINNDATSASTSATTATTKASEASTSASQALTSRNQAQTFAQQAQVSASSVDANNIVHRTGDESIDGIKSFIKSPIVPVPTTGTQAVNKDYADLKVALSQFTGTNQSLYGSGYQKLPGGLIIQWGLSPESVSSGEQFCYMPIAFPTALVSLTHSVAGTPLSLISTIINQNLFSFEFSIKESMTGTRISGQTIYYIAIGF